MAQNDIKILKLDGSGNWTEFNLTAEASKVLGFDVSINPVMVTLPTKASGAEVTAGTDDAKFVTAKALNDAGIVAGGLSVSSAIAYSIALG